MGDTRINEKLIHCIFLMIETKTCRIRNIVRNITYRSSIFIYSKDLHRPLLNEEILRTERIIYHPKSICMKPVSVSR